MIFNFPNCSSHRPQPPTHQPRGGHDADCSSRLLRNVPIHTRDQRPSERHMCHFLFLDPIKEEMEAACMNMCALEDAKKHAKIQTQSHICLFERQGRRDAVSNRWLPCLGQRVSLDSQVTTAAKAETSEARGSYLY